MSKYVDRIEFVTEECCNCGIPFAMTADFQSRRLKDRNSFYCPAGHRQAYIGKSNEQKLKDQLASKQRELERQAQRSSNLQVQRDSLNRSYNKMRDRVKNGVCPCCNRTFQNLQNHIQIKHPDFGTHDVLKTMRALFGLTQSGVAEEIGVTPAYVSLYENEKPMPEYAKAEIEAWITQNSG